MQQRRASASVLTSNNRLFSASSAYIYVAAQLTAFVMILNMNWFLPAHHGAGFDVLFKQT
jgi:hypothetical protein